MDKSILKKFAIESRQDLMNKVSNKIKTFFVNEEFKKEQKGEVYFLSNEKHSLSLTKEENDKRDLLIKRINELTLEQVIEEAAYTWFNRIIAIRYMEINDMLPLTKNNSSLGIRVLSSKDNTPDPEILKFTNLTNPDLDIDFKKEKYIELKDDNEKFKYILLLVCKKLGKVIPQVFDGNTDYIDILIPDNLLNDAGFINKIINDVPEENYNQVEIIGWLYQYYNQTEKDRVISAKKAYKKNEIPYATQLFTPDWIVKYMVENSLGRYWVEHNGYGALYPSDNLYPSNNLYPSSAITDNWKYFIKDNIEKQEEKLKPTEITFIDPCCGSGHILVYAFEVFYQIYTKSGYNKNDIAELILKNNIYGLDIDDRAGQLSILSILLKAREYDKNIFNKEIVKNLNIMSIQESTSITQENINFLKSKKDYLEAVSLNETINYIYDIFQNAKEIGSLLIVDDRDYNKILDKIEELKQQQLDIFDYSNLQEIESNFKCLIKQAIILSKKYDIVVTNPPYMNNSVMSISLKEYILKNFKDVRSDMFSAFIVRNSKYGKNESYLGYMTPYVWMFISSYEELRNYIINSMSISSLIQLEYSALEEATVPICTFVLNNSHKNAIGNYFRLTDFTGGMKIQEQKFLESLENSKNKYIINNEQFKKIPGCPIAYWIDEKFIDVFEKSSSLGSIADVKQGLATADNDRFLRQWYEVNINKTLLNSTSVEVSKKSKAKWYPYNKGGEFRKWYGNNDYVVNWENDGMEIKNFKDDKGKLKSRPQNLEYYFRESVSWSLISSSNIAFRYKPFGHIFDVAGMSYFIATDKLKYLLALSNTNIVQYIMRFIAPTLNYQVGDIAKIPAILDNNKKEIINKLVDENISISKYDWDSFETSWNFNSHTLIKDKVRLYIRNLKEEPNYYLWSIFKDWNTKCETRFNQLKHNEEELNRIFIDIYGLQDELTPEVEDKNITIRKADRVRDIKSLISYAVGCMFGRYSLDEDGLIYAGGEFDFSKYKTFNADNDNIIPITDEAYFNDDIVTKFKQFIEVVYGKGTLNENLDYIAETLGKRGTETSEDTIRRYFVNDFYNDHIKTYQKRPIYWLFDSGKKNGFKCLIYMHRYTKDLVATIRTKYIPKVQTTYEKLLSDVEYKLSTDLSLADKKEMEKKKIELNGKIQEVKEYYEMIANVANKMIDIDLDDGVVVNYAKFTYLNPKTNKEESILGKIK